ncbi:serine protease [Lentzea sp. NBRC 105346]|uniref:S8 family peptidase n=1 Tax=Lentzea sp. NBRC 105346 TaxID=3032205 RepID=UPI0024A547BD|nr:S8 family serine peptidase [Lentzea sp. NBRC 105346]GLZ32388.1 serine protease [Lentzea sp. NBRC 105346]
MHRKKTSALAALALIFGATTAAVAAPEPPGPSIGAPASVTLITGDKVLVGPDGQVVNVQPAEGREQIPVATSVEDGHTFVTPLDATELLAAGKLDRRLFDVTTLLDFGYTQGQLPLIIKGHGVMAARSAENWRALTTSSDKIWLDGLRKPVLDRSAAQIGAPTAWAAGITGKGVKVAVLDTGVDGNHPDLKGRKIAEKNFSSDPDIVDKVGHGTHVASTIAGGDSKYRGIAPDAQLLAGKVCASTSCSDSAILDGMRWAAEQGADVVNLSLGGPDTPEIDPLEEAVNTLSAQYGTLFVIAAGNSGGKETVASPGSADAALTVGAVDREDNIAPFSSRGPRVGDGAIKPDVTAPGVGIVAAKAGTNGDHIAYSGTSMATPHVAGAAALLKSQHPDWTGNQIKSALISSAKPTVSLTPFDQGSGRIDLTKAIKQTAFAEPGSIHLGFQSWPHTDDQPATKQLTYVNPTDEPMTFSVSLQTAAPAGVFSVGSSTITVPAHGKTSVPVVADTRSGATGNLTGTVVATAGDLTLRTPVSVTSEVESYDVTFNYLDRDGKPTASYSTNLVGLDNTKRATPYDPSGTVKTRLPKGDYVTYAYIRSGARLDAVVQPKLVIAANTTVTLDARTTELVDVKFPSAVSGWPGADFSFARRSGNAAFGASMLFFGGFGTFGTSHLGPELPADEFGGSLSTQGKRADEENAFFRFSWQFSGRIPTGFAKAPQVSDLARVEYNIGQQQLGKNYYKGMYPFHTKGISGGRSSSLFTIAGGVRPVEYLTTDSNWQPLVYQLGPGWFNYEVSLQGPPKAFKPGDRITERANYAVFGPSISREYLTLGRAGDRLYASVPVLADNNGGFGYSKVNTAKSVLYRDGVAVSTQDRAAYAYLDVAPGAADYRLETELTRPFEFSTEIKAAWTFRSGHTDPSVYAALPLSVVRFTPKLDDNNSVRAGRLLRVPLVVEQQEGADNGKITSLDVEYSFDDGKTWRRAGVVGGKSALIYHPDIDGYASLRATAKDSKGNTSEVTIMRAYKVTK